MGVDAADLNGDGWQDVLVANIDHEMFALYESHKGAFFTDAAPDHGVSQATRLLSGWGLKFCDFDNDGNVDLLLANGHPDDTIALRAPDVRYKEPLLYFRHDGRRLRNVSAQAGPVFAKSFSARGLAVGDYNNDGRVDVLVGCNGDAPVLLRNNAAAGDPVNHWVGLKLQGVRCNRDAIGARLTWSAGGVRRARQKNGGGSYLSSHDPREVLGLGRGHHARLAGNQMAGARFEHRAIHRRPCRSLRDHRRRQRDPGMRRLLLPCMLALAFGCRAQPPPSSGGTPETTKASGDAGEAVARPQVELPDISGAAAPVQAQLRERFASLQQQIGNAGTPPAALAAAYGEMGRLFMATEFIDPAERCFINARTLDPGEMRWTYYLGTHRAAEERAGKGGRALRAGAETAARPRAEPRLARRNAPRRGPARFRRAAAPEGAVASSRERPRRSIASAARTWPRGTTPAPSRTSKRHSRSGRRRRASTIRWRSPIADWATRETPTPRCGCAGTSTCLRPIR